MGRKPLPIGSWGLIRTEPVGLDEKGKPKRHRASRVLPRLRRGHASGRGERRTATRRRQNLRTKLQNRTLAGRHGDLTAMTRFSDAADLWLTKVDEMVAEGRRSPGHGRHLSTSAEEPRAAGDGGGPAWGGHDAAGRQGDRCDQGRRERGDGEELPERDLGSHGPGGPVRRVLANPVREVERIESQPKREPRALTIDGAGRAAEAAAGGREGTAAGSAGPGVLHARHRRADR